MTKYDHILDNRVRKVVDYLRQHLSTAEVFRLVSAYFTIEVNGICPLPE